MHEYSDTNHALRTCPLICVQLHTLSVTLLMTMCISRIAISLDRFCVAASVDMSRDGLRGRFKPPRTFRDCYRSKASLVRDESSRERLVKCRSVVTR